MINLCDNYVLPYPDMVLTSSTSKLQHFEISSDLEMSEGHVSFMIYLHIF